MTDLALRIMWRFALVASVFVMWATYEEGPSDDVRPEAYGSVGWYMENNDCWTDTAPEGVVPTKVLYRTEAGNWTMGGSHMTHKALEQLFTDKDYGLTVAAFCR